MTYFHRAAGVGVCLGPPASTLGLRAQWRRSIYAFTAPLRRVRDRIQTRRKGAQSSQAQSRSHRCRHRLLEVALFRMKKYILLINFILLFPLACSFPTCQNAAKLVQRETQQTPYISIQLAAGSRGSVVFCGPLLMQRCLLPSVASSAVFVPDSDAFMNTHRKTRRSRSPLSRTHLLSRLSCTLHMQHPAPPPRRRPAGFADGHGVGSVEDGRVPDEMMRTAAVVTKHAPFVPTPEGPCSSLGVEVRRDTTI